MAALARGNGSYSAKVANRRGARSDKAPPETLAPRVFRDPTLCERCGAVYTRKTWRRRPAAETAMLPHAAWDVCPACEQQDRGEFRARVLLRGGFALAHEEEILRRVRNVESRAAFTQPERRVVALRHDPDGIELRTNSQKLAHRIVRELKKAFHGRASFSWCGRDELFAVWERAS